MKWNHGFKNDPVICHRRVCSKKSSKLFFSSVITRRNICCLLQFTWLGRFLFFKWCNRSFDLFEFQSSILYHSVPSHPVVSCFRCGRTTNYASHKRRLNKYYVVANSQNTALHSIWHWSHKPLLFNVEWVRIGYISTFASCPHYDLSFRSLNYS